ncbi:hypothetical protein CsatB_015851 [Cannabis sativa]
MLQMNKFYFQEKGKLKIILSGLLHCLSFLPPNKEKDASAEKVAPYFLIVIYVVIIIILLNS